MDEIRRTTSNLLKYKIEQAIRRSGFDKNFIEALKFHLEILESHIEESNIKSHYDYCNLLMSKLFIDKIEQHPTRRFKCQVNECSEWPLPLLPSEVFGETKPPPEYRKHIFYGCLQTGDALDCRVASVLPAEYLLRVIHKYGATRMLDDLNITVVLPRNKSELHFLQKELLTCELIRVAVKEIIAHESQTEVFVTVCDNTGELTRNRPQLGRISAEDLPSYVLEPPEHTFSSYSAYLNHQPGFQNPLLLNPIYEGFGIDPREVHSFYPSHGSIQPVDGNALLKESILRDVKHFTNVALEELKNGCFEKSFTFVQTAIQIYPKKNRTKNEKAELSKLFEIRGRILREMKKLKMSLDAILDWKLAYKTDPNKKCGTADLSRAAFLTAHRLYKKQDYETAHECIKGSLRLNKINIEAMALEEYLQSKHPITDINLSEESMMALQEKKKKLVTELKKSATDSLCH